MLKLLERPVSQGFAGGSGGCPDFQALVDFWPMYWKQMLAYVTGSVDRELLLRNQYLERTSWRFSQMTFHRSF